MVIIKLTNKYRKPPISPVCNNRLKNSPSYCIAVGLNRRTTTPTFPRPVPNGVSNKVEIASVIKFSWNALDESTLEYAAVKLSKEPNIINVINNVIREIITSFKLFLDISAKNRNPNPSITKELLDIV